jgi:hypothetical protein
MKTSRFSDSQIMAILKQGAITQRVTGHKIVAAELFDKDKNTVRPEIYKSVGLR